MQVETLVLKAAFTSKYTTNRGKVKMLVCIRGMIHFFYNGKLGMERID
jgi:hypothetical protein